MLNFRNYADLSLLIKKNLGKFAPYDLIAGVPRSGMVAACMAALYLNKQVCSLTELECGIEPRHGFSRKVQPAGRRILVVDDTVNTGKSMEYARGVLDTAGISADFCAVYATKDSAKLVDFYLEILEKPRIFEWNYLNNSLLRGAAVVCEDVLMKGVRPAGEERMRRYFEEISPALLNGANVGFIISGFGNRFYVQMESWLEKHGITCGRLFMCGGGGVYSKPGAEEIARLCRGQGAKLILAGGNARAKAIAAASGIASLSDCGRLYGQRMGESE